MERRRAGQPPGQGWIGILVAGLLSTGTTSAQEFRLELTSARCAPGGDADIFLLSSHSRPLYGLQASIHVPPGVTVESADADGCSAVCGSQSFEVSPEPGCIALGIVLDWGAAGRTLPPSERARVAHLRVEVSVDVPLGTVLPIELRDGCRRLGNRVSVALEPSGARSVAPEVSGGSIEVASVSRPREAPAFELPGRCCRSDPLPVDFDGQRESPLCEAEVSAVDAGCPDRVVPLEDGRVPAAAFREAGSYSLRLRLGNDAGWGPWSRASAVEVRDCVPFLRADANGDGAIDVSDPISTLLFLFRGSGRAPCAAAADANGDETVDVSDCVHGLSFLFRDGPVPPPPFPSCGVTPPGSTDVGALGCDDPGSCGGGG